MSEEVKPAANQNPIYVSKDERDSILRLEEEIQNEDRYQSIVIKEIGGEGSTVRGEFGSYILCSDCANNPCLIHQPQGYRYPKYIQCPECGYVYYNVEKKND